MQPKIRQHAALATTAEQKSMPSQPWDPICAVRIMCRYSYGHGKTVLGFGAYEDSNDAEDVHTGNRYP